MSIFYNWPFPQVYFAKNVASIIFLLILGLVFSDCVIFYGDIIVILSTAITVEIVW